MCFDCYSEYQPVKYGNIQEVQHAYFSFAHFPSTIFGCGILNLP